MDLPLHRWVQLEQEGRTFLGFTYLDPDCGPSAKGAPVDRSPTEEQLCHVRELATRTVRLDPALPLRMLDEAEQERWALPRRPEWLSLYQPEIPHERPWLGDRRLRGQLAEASPDDLQALFFFPSAELKEALFVRLQGEDPEVGGYRGLLLVTPQRPVGLMAGMGVTVRPSPGASAPVYVNRTARENLRRFRASCTGCQFDLLCETIDPAREGTFLTRCVLCEEPMRVEPRS